MIVPIALIVTLVSVLYLHCTSLRYIRMTFELKLSLCGLLDVPGGYPYLAYAEHIRNKKYSFFSGLVSTKTVMEERRKFLREAVKPTGNLFKDQAADIYKYPMLIPLIQKEDDGKEFND